MITFLIYFISIASVASIWFSGYWWGRAKQAKLNLEFIEDYNDILSCNTQEELDKLKETFKDECT